MAGAVIHGRAQPRSVCSRNEDPLLVSAHDMRRRKMPMHETVCAMFAEVAAKQPDAPAILEDGRTITFAELSALSAQIAEGIPQGVQAVGIVMRHRAEMIASIFAAARRGIVYVPAEPFFPARRIDFMMHEAGAERLLADKEYEGRHGSVPVIYPDCEICERHREVPACSDSCRPGTPLYVLYTSGTTGQPKGVCVTNANVCHYVRAFRDEFHMGPGDVMLQHSVCSFDIFVEEVFCSLLNGAALAIPSEEVNEDLPALMDFVDRHHVTAISGFPYLLAEMNDLDAVPESVRLIISGGDVLRAAYVDRLLHQAEVYNTYGPSETTVCATYYRCRNGQILEDGTYPIGRPVKGTQVRLLDEEGKEVPRGEAGEICIFGDGVSLGYVGNREAENRAFVETEGGRMYRSGDLGRMLDSGDIDFLRRKDSQIMILGRRVEILEVEAALYQCEGVLHAVVRSFRDEDDLAYMTAYIVPKSGELSASRIRAQLAERLPEYMIPEFIVEMRRIPLNPNGKPDLAQLPVVLKAG